LLGLQFQTGIAVAPINTPVVVRKRQGQNARSGATNRCARTPTKSDFFFDPAILEETSSVHIDIHEVLERSAAFEQALLEREQQPRNFAELSPPRWTMMNNSVGKIVRRGCDRPRYSKSILPEKRGAHCPGLI
jgi:hypothetical protein